MIDLKSTPVSSLKGVGEKTKSALEKAGIFTCLDLVRLYPRSYEDRTPRYLLTDAPDGAKVSLIMRVVSSARIGYTPTKKKIVRFSARQREGLPAVHIAFFNQTYLANTFRVGEDFRFYGKLIKNGGGYYMFSPSFERVSDMESDVIPIYPAFSGISSSRIAKLIRGLLGGISPLDIEDTLPESVLRENMLMPLGKALFEIHMPTDEKLLERAKERLIFEELFEFSLATEKMKRRSDTEIAPSMKRVDMKPFEEALGFEMTSAQKRSVSEIYEDLTSTKEPHLAMRRLLQGDVGSGKTAVAAAAIYITLMDGGKAALMAPTEILAEQHFESLSPIFSRFGFETLLLTGSTARSKRNKIKEALISGSPLLIVGTHALFEDEGEVRDLNLVITDEEHRFGVLQRAKLLERASVKNKLTMSATPIPRTLARFLFAGLDVSVLDELPPGRQSVTTLLISPDKKERMYSFIEDEVRKGNQAYIVCPLVEESEEERLERELSGKGNLTSATALAMGLRERFSSFPVGLLHGKMKSEEKRRVMEAFKQGEIKVLVSTTVIEVGVNVPRATVMAIENAERFGLAQLHQLRGRIGRGSEKSWCIFITSSKSEEALSRLAFMTKCHDGFKIAEYDLETRGPGDFFGERQHGEISLPLSSSDTRLFKSAMEAAERYLDKKEKE